MFYNLNDISKDKEIIKFAVYEETANVKTKTAMVLQ